MPPSSRYPPYNTTNPPSNSRINLRPRINLPILSPLRTRLRQLLRQHPRRLDTRQLRLPLEKLHAQSLGGMPDDMAVEEPSPRVVGLKGHYDPAKSREGCGVSSEGCGILAREELVRVCGRVEEDGVVGWVEGGGWGWGAG